jgi:hypothetical protein
MLDPVPPGGCLAFLDLSGVEGFIFFALRIFLAGVFAVVAWFVSGPVIRLLYRLAFHRPTPGPALFTGRAGSAVLVGVLVFLYFPLGGGLGWGWGPGSGGGPGLGPGLGGSPGTGTGKGEGKTSKEGTEQEPGKDVLRIELAWEGLYDEGSDRYYVVQGKGAPRALGDVEELLRQNPGRWGKVEVIMYKNGPDEKTLAVQQLKKLVAAQQPALEWVEPLQYRQIEKLVSKTKG